MMNSMVVAAQKIVDYINNHHDYTGTVWFEIDEDYIIFLSHDGVVGRLHNNVKLFGIFTCFEVDAKRILRNHKIDQI